MEEDPKYLATESARNQQPVHRVHVSPSKELAPAQEATVSPQEVNFHQMHEDETINDVHYVKEDLQKRVSRPVWFLIVGTILSSCFLFALDDTIVADIQSPILKRFNEPRKMSWIGIAFVLASASTVITWGKVYGIFSAKYLFLISVVLFEGGSALCGGANTMNAFIVGRAIAGLGGAGLYLGCLTLLTITTSIHQRPAYMAFTGITWGAGTVLGPVVGGAFSDNRHAGWRWSFYINLCIGAVASPVYIFMLPKADPHPEATLRAKLLQIDYLGAFLNVSSLVCLTMALNFGGDLYDWNSGPEIALWVVGGALLLLFCLQQAFTIGTTKRERIFPLELLRQPLMWLLFALMAAAGTCVFVPTYYIPIYCQFVLGDTPLGSAVRLLPFIIVMVFVGLASGAGMSILGFYMPWYFFGGILTSIGGGLMSTIKLSSHVGKIYGYSVLIGLGAGLFIQTGYSVAQAKVPSSRASDASSFIALAQNIGFMLSLAISGAVFQNEAVDKLHVLLPTLTREQLHGAITGASSGMMQHLPDELRKKVLEAIVEVMGHTYYLVATAGVMAAVGSLFMKRERIFVEGATAMG
ncbi:hypothetical protein N7478_007569 [Penicillium angulare]|uniref:uncharacterized protein n=1 Tax=Penicillium angulare TaxID=116970 RepID=UPI00253F9DD5|nr:uncharacterized protein N7478_007569 [Penicillium angulare]KAJ5272444.1 hypothetical protein N7478_007569 [Penicillium angulare]